MTMSDITPMANLTLDEVKETFPNLHKFKLHVDKAIQKASMIGLICFITGHEPRSASVYFNRLKLSTDLMIDPKICLIFDFLGCLIFDRGKGHKF